MCPEPIPAMQESSRLTLALLREHRGRRREGEERVRNPVCSCASTLGLLSRARVTFLEATHLTLGRLIFASRRPNRGTS